ncbi:MAG: transporter [Caulobacteraceae bacterium]|nr:transporter [Caulobacteraceae bacterium]
MHSSLGSEASAGVAAVPARGGVAIVGVVALLLAIAVLNNMDRVLLAVLAEPIKAEFGLSDTQFGSLSGAIFAIFYTGGAVPIAWLADRFGRARVLGACAVLWSVATALSGAAGSFLQMSLARMSVGLGEAGCTPTIHALVTENVPATWRGRALGVIGAGSAIGTMGGLWLGGFLADVVGWRWTFAVVGAPGVIAGVAVALVLRRPAGRRDAGKAGAAAIPFRTIIRTFGASPTFLLKVLAAVTATAAIVGLQSFMAAYAMRTFSLPIRTVGFWLGIAAVGGILGMLVGGACASRTHANGAIAMRLPALLCIAGGLIAATGFLIGAWPLTIVMFGIGNAMFCTWYAPVYASVQAEAPPQARAQLSAIVLVASSLLGVGGGPTLVGFLSDRLSAGFGVRSLGVSLAIICGGAVVAGGAIFLADLMARGGFRVAPQTFNKTK